MDGKKFDAIMAGLAGFGLGRMSAPVQTRVETNYVPVEVEVPVEVPVYIHPSEMEKAVNLNPPVALFFILTFHLVGYAEEIAKKDGWQNLDNANFSQKKHYMDLAGQRLYREMLSLIDTTKSDPNKVVIPIWVMNTLFHSLLGQIEYRRKAH